MQRRDFETYQKHLKILRSCQNFPRPTFFGEPFAIPTNTWPYTTNNHLHACGKLARSNEQTTQETNSSKHTLISMCIMQLRLNYCVAQCKIY